MNTNYAETLAARLCGHVSAKLGTPVTFARWDRLPTGADLPVFNVPQSHEQQARELGLTVA